METAKNNKIKNKVTCFQLSNYVPAHSARLKYFASTHWLDALYKSMLYINIARSINTACVP